MPRGSASKRLQLSLPREVGDKIEELATRMNVSEAKMAEFLIEAAIEDHEWIIKAVTSRWVKAAKAVLGGARAKRAVAKPST